MYLPRDDQQWGHIAITGLPDGIIPLVQIGDSAWTPMTNDTDGRWKILLRGPDYSTDTAGLLVTATSRVRVRAIATPESASVDAGWIRLLS